MKKLIYPILIVFMVFMGGYSQILADDVTQPGSNIGGGITAPFTACNGGLYCWNGAPKPSGTRIQAIRVSIVDASGNRWPGTISVDYFKHDDTANKAIFQQLKDRTKTNYYGQKKYTKNEIVVAKQAEGNRTTAGDYTLRSGTIKLDVNAFPKFNGANTNVLKPYFLRIASTKDNMRESFFIPTFLTPLGFNYEAEKEKLKTNPNHFKNIALLIEPVVFFRLTSNRGGKLSWTLEYAGTVTEVAHMLSSQYAKDDDYDGDDRYFDLIKPGATYRDIHFSNPTIFDLDYPLAIYATESKGGLVGIQHWIESGYSDNYSAEILTRNGVAAGHVWFNELFCPAPNNITTDDLPTCCDELIDANKVNSTNYSKCCSALYAKGKLTASHLPTCCYVLPTSDPLYISKCTTPTPPSSQCPWKLDISCPDNCFNKTKGFVKDMDNWDCIFKSRNATRANIRTHFYEWSNQYCDFYCREEVNYQLPQSGFVVQAGHHFTVGMDGTNSWAPIQFEGLSECRSTSDTKNIKHIQFQEDYNAIDETIPGLWKEYKKQQILDMSRNAASRSSSKNCDNYCDYNVKGLTCCKAAERDWDDCYYGSPNACVGGRGADGKWNPCLTTRNTCRGGYGPWYCTRDDTPYDHGYTMTPPPKSSGAYGPYTERTWCTTNGSGNEQTKPSSGTPAAERAYNNAIQARDELLRQIKLCNDWQRDYSHFLPKVFLDFEEDIYGFTNLELTPRVENNIYTEFYVGSSYRRGSYLRIRRTTKHTCSGFQECVKGETDYPANDNIRQYYYRTVEFGLPSGLNQYVSKPAGFSSNTKPTGKYVDVGYSNLPVHYSRLPDKYEISLKYTTFGRNHKFNKYVFDGVSFTGNYADSVRCNQFYKCSYNVDNEFLEDCNESCDKYEKLNVVFRPISLSNPFPGKDGEGRTPGSNWRWSVSKITRNRGLTNPERIFFDKDPMYVIELTPELIRSIRVHNRTQDGGYGNFDLNCDTGTGRQCKSTFIRETYRNYFSGCGTSENWNACS